MNSSVHVFVSGRVQGVFFRASAKEAADSLGLTGWVRNLSDGRVEAVFEGEDDKVDEMLDWCWHGPPAAEVFSVEEEDRAPEGFTGFRVLPSIEI